MTRCLTPRRGPLGTPRPGISEGLRLRPPTQTPSDEVSDTSACECAEPVFPRAFTPLWRIDPIDARPPPSPPGHDVARLLPLPPRRVGRGRISSAERPRGAPLGR